MSYMDSFDAFCLFLSLKNHFTQESYDFERYNGKTNATRANFEKRKDLAMFQKLARRGTHDTLPAYIIANLLDGKSWIGQFLEDDAELNFSTFDHARQNLIETVVGEVKQALETSTPTALFKPNDHEYPHIILARLDGTVSFLAMVVLNNLVQFVPRYDDVLAGDEVWASMSLMIRKLTPFVQYDDKAVARALKPILLP